MVDYSFLVFFCFISSRTIKSQKRTELNRIIRKPTYSSNPIGREKQVYWRFTLLCFSIVTNPTKKVGKTRQKKLQNIQRTESRSHFWSIRRRKNWLKVKTLHTQIEFFFYRFRSPRFVFFLKSVVVNNHSNFQMFFTLFSPSNSDFTSNFKASKTSLSNP